MNKIAPSVLIVAIPLAVLGCQSGQPAKPGATYLEASQVPEPPEPVVREVEVPVSTPQLRRLPTAGQTEGATEGDDPAAPEQTIAEATEQATHGPTPEGFIEAVQTYDYLPGAVYEVFASPGHVTTIALRPGERLIAKAAGDTARWTVADSHTGSGPDTRTLLLVKPLKPHVETNLTVSTDQRMYQIDLKSLPDAYHSEVRWHYPHDLAHQLAQNYRKRAARDDAVIEQSVELTGLDFGYRLRIRGEKPDWTPKRIFTDGRKTYIAFPEDLASMQVPPLFVLGRKGQAQLVNYRAKANYYIVDQVIKRAQLRLGEDPQRIVGIERIEQ